MGDVDEERRGKEAFRVAQHGRPLAEQLLPEACHLIAEAAAVEPDMDRVVLHFDVDAFYAQVEEVRDPSLRERPLGVTQKYLIVTSNYPARRSGVTKLMAIDEARRVCPDLVLVSGEDLTPYRSASRKIQAVLERFGVVERGGMDECFVDVTGEVNRRINSGGLFAPDMKGHVYTRGSILQQDNPHRPQDLRMARASGGGMTDSSAGAALAENWVAEPWWQRLVFGSHIAAEARAAVKMDTGFRSSCGIACNKMLAKLISGLHKPDDQTTMPPPLATGFMATLPVRAIPGVGYKMNSQLKTQLGVETVLQLLRVDQPSLARELGGTGAVWLWGAARGKDASPVVAKGPPKSITVEDSFKHCNSHEAATQVLRVLAPDLLQRLEEDKEEFGRRAATLTVKWRQRGQGRGFGRTSASCPMPILVHSSRTPAAEKANLVVTAAAALLRRHLAGDFSLAVINLGATNLRACGSCSNDADVSIQGMLLGAKRVSSQDREAERTPSERDAAATACSSVSPEARRSSWAVAEAAAMRRRSYVPGPSRQSPIALTKRQERELRERPSPAMAVSSFFQGEREFSTFVGAGETCSSPGMRDGGSAEQVPISHHVPIPGPWGAQTAAANRCSDSDEPFEARIDAADCQEEQDRQLAMRLQQQEVDEFRRISRMQGARASSQRDKTKLSLGSGPLDAFVKRTKR